jgi:hypothetical protein
MTGKLKSFAWMGVGVAIGYLADPELGGQRRARLRDLLRGPQPVVPRPVPSSDAIERNEPVVFTEPIELDEPAAVAEPVVLTEPAQPSESAELDEPARPSDPIPSGFLASRDDPQFRALLRETGHDAADDATPTPATAATQGSGTQRSTQRDLCDPVTCEVPMVVLDEHGRDAERTSLFERINAG